MLGYKKHGEARETCEGLAIVEFEKDIKDVAVRIIGGVIAGGLLGWLVVACYSSYYYYETVGKRHD